MDVDPGITVTDNQSGTITSAAVSITSGYVSGEDTLGFVTQGNTSGSFVPSTGTLTLTGTATVAQYQAALKLVTYDDTNHDATTTDRTISFSVNDGIGPGNGASGTVQPLADVATQFMITTQDRRLTRQASGSG